MAAERTVARAPEVSPEMASGEGDPGLATPPRPRKVDERCHSNIDKEIPGRFSTFFIVAPLPPMTCSRAAPVNGIL